MGRGLDGLLLAVRAHAVAAAVRAIGVLVACAIGTDLLCRAISSGRLQIAAAQDKGRVGDGNAGQEQSEGEPRSSEEGMHARTVYDFRLPTQTAGRSPPSGSVRRWEGRLRALGHETVAAQDRLAALGLGARLERHLALRAARRADGVEHFALAHAIVLALGAAILTALRSLKALGRIELLFTLGEREGLTAIAAGKLLISHTERGEGR